MEITPYKNGIHSLAEGLRYLNSFLHEGTDPFKMKEVVIRIHHGLETLFKDILFQKNPIFLLDEKTTIKQVLECYQGFFEGKNNYLFDEAKTITPTDAIKRIKALRIGGDMTPKDFAHLTESFDTLNALRNQLQHFALKANPDVIVRVLGNLVPRAITLLKMCYAQDLSHPFLTRSQAVPHQALAGMAQLFSFGGSIEKDLDAIFPEASKVIAGLEARYDVLLHEAIKKFEKSTFHNIKQTIKITDHGHVGAPPYMPSIALNGWLNETFEPHRNAVAESYRFLREPITACYGASLKIEQPVVKEVIRRSWSGDVVSELTITCESTVSVLSPEGFFNIPGAEEYISFVKNPQVTIKIQILCEVEGMYDEHHFDIRAVRSLSGSMSIEMSSVIYGDTAEKPSILGTQSIQLHRENTALRFHAFVETNKRLRDNYSLEITIEGAEDIVFK